MIVFCLCLFFLSLSKKVTWCLFISRLMWGGSGGIVKGARKFFWKKTKTSIAYLQPGHFDCYFIWSLNSHDTPFNSTAWLWYKEIWITSPGLLQISSTSPWLLKTSNASQYLGLWKLQLPTRDFHCTHLGFKCLSPRPLETSTALLWLWRLPMPLTWASGVLNFWKMYCASEILSSLPRLTIIHHLILVSIWNLLLTASC